MSVNYNEGENVFLKAYGRYETLIERGEGVYLYDTISYKA